MWRVRGSGDNRHAFSILVGKPESKKPFGRHRHRCEGNMEIYIEEIGWEALIGIFWLKRKRSGEVS